MWKTHLRKQWQKVTAYLRTWRELLLRPVAFAGMSERQAYTTPQEFVAWTFVIAAVLTYIACWTIGDPLYPPGAVSIASPTMLYLSLMIFLGLWWIFGILVVRIFKRQNPNVPMKKIFTALVYLVLGTGGAVQVLFFAISAGMVFVFLMPPVLAFAQEHFYFLVFVGLLFLGISFTPAFFTAWLITKAVRQFSPIGTIRGIVLPAICWAISLGLIFYFHRSTTTERLSKQERNALRRLYVLSDLESVSTCRNNQWETDFEKLKFIAPRYHECEVWNPIVSAEGLIAKSYTREMVGYRFTIQTYRSGRDCLIWALPTDYGGQTKLSFAKRCALDPDVDTLTVVQDIFGGRPNMLVGRVLVVGLDWQIERHNDE